MAFGLDADILNETLRAIVDFSHRTLPPDRVLDLDHEDVCPVDTVRQMCGDELGIQLIFIPEEYGGMGGATYDVYRVCETMAGIDLGVATSVLATFLGTDPIVVGATPDQRKHWLSRVAEEGLLFAYGATEPDAGSDLGALKTKAVPVQDNGRIAGYRISGRKQWISNGAIADAWTILANTEAGPTWFVLDGGADGFAAGKPEDKHGIRLSNTSALFLDDVYIPVENLIGGVEGQGLVQAQLVFGYTRVMVAAFGLGAGWAAVNRAVDYSTQRKVAGSPLSEKQGATHKLIVPHVVHLEAARAYIEETAEKIDAEDQGLLNTEGAIAKYMATESGNAAAEAAIQVHGGYGYTREYQVEKIKRDVRITTIYEGTSEIMEMTIARDRWQLHLKTRGSYYHDLAASLEQLAARDPSSGAGTAALACHALADLLELARIGRLTRHQHVLFRLGELIAWAESASTLAKKACRHAAGNAHAKVPTRFDLEALRAIARVFARESALKVATEGIRLLRGTSGLDAAQLAGLDQYLRLAQIEQAQDGLLDDMDKVCAAIYATAPRLES
jgi:alkylation response protein AidB-like acyl-CoA dehydrogenase